MELQKSIPESSITTPISEGGNGFEAVHLLIMGLSGAGKSTFVAKATGDTSIVTGDGIRGGKDPSFLQLSMLCMLNILFP